MAFEEHDKQEESPQSEQEGIEDSEQLEQEDLEVKEDSFFNFESLRFFFLCILAVLAFRSSFFAPYEVPTASMEPTIKVGDRIIANKLAYGFRLPFIGQEVARWGKVQRGDIIVFRYPLDPDTDFVKRVVAVGGDQVQLINDILYVNDLPVVRQSMEHERYVLRDVSDRADIKHLYAEDIGDMSYYVTQDTRGFAAVARNRNWPVDGATYVVPEDSVFVMGDNRDNSHDSRKWRHVPLTHITARAEFVLWSARPTEGLFSEYRWDRFFSGLYPDVLAAKSSLEER